MGHMNKPLFDLDQPGLQAEVDSYKPGNGLIWPVLFPLKYTPKFDLKGIEGEDGWFVEWTTLQDFDVKGKDGAGNR